MDSFIIKSNIRVENSTAIIYLRDIHGAIQSCAMITKPAVTAVICVGFFLILQALIPKATALRNPSDVDRLMMEGQRTPKRKSYMLQKARGNEITGSFENGAGITYDVEPYDLDRNPEELSAFIVDYANMIRNDVILLDKSVETRTRKRGNIKVKKCNQVIPDAPCSCKPYVDYEDLGDDVFPRIIEIRNCSESNSCIQPYKCRENVYDLPILKKKQSYMKIATTPETPEDTNNIQVHRHLELNWYAVKIPISVGCTCVLGYVTKI